MSAKEKKEPAPLTMDTAWEALEHVSCVSPDGDPLCPTCKGDLALRRNGGEPRAVCSDCGDVTGVLQVVAAQPVPKGPAVDKLAVLRTRLKLPELTRVVKHGKLGTNYVLYLLDGREVDIGNVVSLTTQAKFRAAFLPQVGHNPPRYKPGEWDDIAELIEQLSDQRETSSDAEETIGWVLAATNGQLRTVDTASSSTMFDLLGEREPSAFADLDRAVHIRLAALQTWLSRQGGVRMPATELGGRLSRVGFEAVQISARGGEPSTVRKARYWKCPHVLLYT